MKRSGTFKKRKKYFFAFFFMKGYAHAHGKQELCGGRKNKNPADLTRYEYLDTINYILILVE